MVLTQLKQINQITALFMGQTDLKTGLWFPIKKMTWDYIDGEYLNCITVYTTGARRLLQMYPNNPHLVGFGSLDRVRKDKDIYRCPFANRMPLSREPLPEKLSVLGLDSEASERVDPVKYVARSGGYRHGDNNDLFPEITPDVNGVYNFYFLPISSYQIAHPDDGEFDYLTPGEKLNPILIDNQIKLQHLHTIIGSTPGYITELIKKYQDALALSIAKINSNVPKNYKLLCRASLDRSIGTPFKELEYQPINKE
jgi:hypothetical protein